MHTATQTETKALIEKQKARCFTSKANDSFNTKLKMYLFNMAINQTWESFSQEDFTYFKIDQKLVNEFTTEYWQEFHDYTINGLTINQIYKIMEEKRIEFKDEIEKFRKDYVAGFEKLYERNNFYKFLDTDKCEYCGISITELEKLAITRHLHKKNERGWKLEIDRKDSNLEYTANNCVMACYWCNNAKTDEFTYEEFKAVGKEIRKIWDNRLLIQIPEPSKIS